jgi:hypothetical protein
MVYGAIAYCPHSPLADVHNLVRVAVEADNIHHARARMLQAGCRQVAFLKLSDSHIEIMVAECEQGRVMASSLITCYTDWRRWQPLKVRRSHKKKEKEATIHVRK